MGNNVLTIVTDIPTPYRIHLFNHLHSELAKQQAEMQVFFMARTVPIRFWSFDEAQCKFRYKIARGLHAQIGGHFLHFNPGILLGVVKRRPRWLMLGGAWYLPTVVALLLMAVSLRSTRVMLWAEANDKSMVHKKGLIARLRSIVARRFSAFVVPGDVAERTLENYWHIGRGTFLRLPNIVDEDLFRDRVGSLRNRRAELRAERGLIESDLVMLWPARLHEQTKGIVNFLSAVRDLLTDRVKIYIAGEGPDRRMVEDWIGANLSGQVVLLGQCAEDEMARLFAVADVLLLPSLRDPNPLSVIEALWSGLPLFISTSCGNWPEALEGGSNGWLIDSASPSSARESFEGMLATPPEEMRRYGRRSLQIAEARFSTERCVSSFVRELTALQ